MTSTQLLEPVPLGKSSLSIRPIGVGTWAWGDRVFWNYPHGYNEADIRASFEISMQAGVDFIDTAEAYGFGAAERMLGNFLAAAEQKPILASKFYPFPWRLTKASFRQALQGSLKRLQRESLDIYMIHWPMPPSRRVWVKALADAVREGLVHLAGISNFSTAQMRDAHQLLADRDVALAVTQVPYSLLNRTIEHSGMFEASRELGITVMAYSPLEQGLLTGKFSAQNPPPDARGRAFAQRMMQHIDPLLGLMREVGEAHRVDGDNRSVGEVAIAWVIAKGAVTIPGAKNAKQAAQNVKALTLRLSPEEVAALDEASEAAIPRSLPLRPRAYSRLMHRMTNRWE